MQDELIRARERIADLEQRKKVLREALEGLRHRHCDGSEEQYWAEWDAVDEALKKGE